MNRQIAIANIAHELKHVGKAILCYKHPEVLIQALNEEISTWNGNLERYNSRYLPHEYTMRSLEGLLLLRVNGATDVSNAFHAAVQTERSSVYADDLLLIQHQYDLRNHYFGDPPTAPLNPQRDERVERLNALLTTAWDDSLQITETRH
jgi:hypothetical protein